MIIGVSLSKPTLMWRIAWWSMCKEPWWKTEFQHTTVVWYGGSCINKHDKPMCTSTQLLCNTKIFGFIYWCSILGWYGQPFLKLYYHLHVYIEKIVTYWTYCLVFLPYLLLINKLQSKLHLSNCYFVTWNISSEKHWQISLKAT